MTAADPADVTGPNSVATGANIIYSANMYPNGRLVSDGKTLGFFTICIGQEMVTYLQYWRPPWPSG